MSVRDYLLLVGSTYATGTMYCADVVSLIPDVANWPPDRLIGQYADPSTGRLPCLIRVTTAVGGPAVTNRLLVRERDLPERAVGLVEVVSDGAVPWDRHDGKPPRTIPFSFQLAYRDAADCGQLTPRQLEKRERTYVAELRRRAEDPSEPAAKLDATQRGTGKRRVPETPGVPTYRAHYRRWYRTWMQIQGQAKRADPVPGICEWLQNMHPELPHSVNTVAAIIRAGEAGLLTLGKALK